jgi:mono/diheme cytochrome c family protein
MLDRRVLAVLLLTVGSAGCSGQGSGLSAQAERGRQIYAGQCTSCHSPDPAQNGPLGPAVKGSSRALIEARVLRGVYPPGYTPKRPSAIMQPMPQLAGSIDDLAAYLR